MKKIITRSIVTFVALGAMVFTFTSCTPIEPIVNVNSNATSTASTAVSAAASTPETTSAPVEPAPEPAEPNVKKEGDTVIITLPKALIAEGDTGELTTEQIHSGFVSAKRNDDGSMSYTLSNASYMAYVEALKNQTTAMLNEMVGSGNYKSVKEVMFNKELNEVTMVVSQTQYQGGTDRLATKGIGLQLATYQLFAGVQERDVRVVVNVENSETGEVIDTIVYPDALA